MPPARKISRQFFALFCSNGAAVVALSSSPALSTSGKYDAIRLVPAICRKRRREKPPLQKGELFWVQVQSSFFIAAASVEQELEPVDQHELQVFRVRFQIAVLQIRDRRRALGVFRFSRKRGEVQLVGDGARIVRR